MQTGVSFRWVAPLPEQQKSTPTFKAFIVPPIFGRKEKKYMQKRIFSHLVPAAMLGSGNVLWLA